jgi:ABC-type multidrug transport system fused ATPase/permease subunit
VTRSSLAAQPGIVFQDTFLFHASIADNLRYARPDATGDDLASAATGYPAAKSSAWPSPG